MKKIIFIFICFITISGTTLAHGGNISGWNDRYSNKITEHNGKYYGYHNQEGKRHYHEVEWNEEKNRWEILKTAVCYDENFNIIENKNENPEKRTVSFASSVDGDTAKFIMDNEQITVRFLGIDTPETVHPTKQVEAYGIEASDFTKEALQNATKIELEFDKNSDEKDKYDRYLAWIWVDDVLLQKQLVENGLANLYMLKDSYTYAGVLQQAEEYAQDLKIGIWESDNLNDENNYNELSSNIVNEIDNEDRKSYYIISKDTLLVLILVTVLTVGLGMIKRIK